jgi:hypothetical protein
VVRARWLAVLLLLGTACRTVVPVTPLAAGDPRPAAALASWGEISRQRLSLRGRAQLAVDGADRGRAKLVVVLERPAQLRVEVLGFLNQTAAVIATDGTHFEVFRSADRSYESGAVEPDLLWREARIGLTPRETVELLLGVPLLEGGIAARGGVETGEGWIRFDLVDAEGRRHRSASFDAALRLRALEAFASGDEPIWSATYDGYETVGGAPFAHRVVLEVAAGGTRVEISLRDVELNPELSADIFQLRIPPAAGAARGEGG